MTSRCVVASRCAGRPPAVHRMQTVGHESSVQSPAALTTRSNASHAARRTTKYAPSCARYPIGAACASAPSPAAVAAPTPRCRYTSHRVKLRAPPALAHHAGRESMRVTPAMAAGVTNKLWSFDDVALVVEAWEAKRPKKPRGPYKKRAA